jgi:S-adenosylmethionine synthetase
LELHRTRFKWLRPDGKSQVTVEYRDGRPASVRSVVVAAQHDESISTQALRDAAGGRALAA